MDLHGAAPVDDHLIGQSSPRIYPVGDAVANLGRAFGWWLVLVTKSWRMIGNGRSRLHALAIFQHRPPANSKPEQPSSCRVSPPSANLEPKNPAAGRGLEWVEKETFFPRITVKTSLTIAGMHALYACLSGLACRRSCTSRTSCEVTSKHASTRVCFSMKQEYYDARYRHRTWCWGITATHQATVAGEKNMEGKATRHLAREAGGRHFSRPETFPQSPSPLYVGSSSALLSYQRLRQAYVR